MTEITSAQNKMIKRVKQLTQKKYRDRESAYLLEGLRFVSLAVGKGHLCEAVLVKQSVYSQVAETLPETEIYCVEDAVFDSVAQTEHTQGVLGVMKRKAEIPLERFLKEAETERKENALILLDRIQDPGNMGTIIRTADAAGVATVLLSKGCVDPYNEKVLRSTAGSILNVRLIFLENSIEAVEWIKKSGYRVIATALANSRDYDEDACYGEKNCLMIGNEGQGIDPGLLSAADVCIKIPIYGGAESLNAAVAAGICIYRMRSAMTKKALVEAMDL